jgi:hypothetical protein
VTVAACSDVAPTAPASAAVAMGDVVVASAQGQSTSCTYTSNGTNFDATVTWAGLSVTSVELFSSAGSLRGAVLNHPTRKGSLTFTNVAQPDHAIITARDGRHNVFCFAAS